MNLSYRGLNVVHVAIDKDMLQLVEPGVHVMHPFTREISGPDEARLGADSFIDDLWPLL